MYTDYSKSSTAIRGLGKDSRFVIVATHFTVLNLFAFLPRMSWNLQPVHFWPTDCRRVRQATQVATSPTNQQPLLNRSFLLVIMSCGQQAAWLVGWLLVGLVGRTACLLELWWGERQNHAKQTVVVRFVCGETTGEMTPLEMLKS